MDYVPVFISIYMFHSIPLGGLKKGAFLIIVLGTRAYAHTHTYIHAQFADPKLRRGIGSLNNFSNLQRWIRERNERSRRSHIF